MKKRLKVSGLNSWVVVGAFLFIEVLLGIILFGGVLNEASAGVGQNVTVITYLTVGTVPPEILNITIDYGNLSVDLVPNATKNVTINVVIRDYNNESDIRNVSIRFFDNVNSSYAFTADNNNHYRNDSCDLNLSYGDIYEARASCVIPVWYYAYNSTWNASVVVNDSSGLIASGSNYTTINPLLALGLPDSINYGVVNSTYVSSEVIANVTNFGNVMLNLSLRGYARTDGDNLSMNCSLGVLKNISVYYEKYNLTASNNTPLSLSQFESIYTNLTGNVTVKQFNLDSRQDDVTNEAINATYWRMYVPVGVAGTCTGNIVFGAIKAPGS